MTLPVSNFASLLHQRLFLWCLQCPAGAIALSANKACLRDGVSPGKKRVLWRVFGPGAVNNNGKLQGTERLRHGPGRSI